MTELNGTLHGIGLQALLSFLEGLRSGGSLVVEDGPWTGKLMLTEGQLVGAQFGAEQGLAALDAILLALPRGRFTFSSDIESCEVNIVLKPGDLGEHLEAIGREATQLMAAVPSLGAVPYVLKTNPADGEDGQITLSRRALSLLLALDDRLNVAALAKERGVLLTLRELAELTKLGLVGMDKPASKSPAEKTLTAIGLVEELQAARAAEVAEDARSAPARLRTPLETRAAEPRRPTTEPDAKPGEPAHNGTTPGRRFWHQP